MKFQSFTLAALLAATAAAHPHVEPTVQELARRSALSRRCAAQAGKFNEARKKRAVEKRSIIPSEHYQKRSGNTTVQVTTEAPYYDTIQNETCVLTPDVTAGPYVWPRSQTLRQDMSEDQLGPITYLDIGVLNVNTCEPLTNALVDLWHCNATGSYSSFTGDDPNTPFGELLAQKNLTIGPGLDLHTDDTTFLRGMWPTDENGMMEMKTVFPGFYVERTIHIHAQVHTEWQVRANGTIVASNTVGTGQLFFDEELSQQIMALEPYASHTQIDRTTNDIDSIYSGEIAGGWNPAMTVVPLDGEDVTNGMIAYITIGVEA
ncbi:protocatechuate 3 [Thozetella sp. PMI_491]|nr:protocatechuate 3 [Thozetella sp. PMI_491]